ncbi:MAG: DUF6020 family protein [Oscillospiraceae bacterium]|nr:DUF6020 family protein [Oscillospiraceae bacterium]
MKNLYKQKIIILIIALLCSASLSLQLKLSNANSLLSFVFIPACYILFKSVYLKLEGSSKRLKIVSLVLGAVYSFTYYAGGRVLNKFDSTPSLLPSILIITGDLVLFSALSFSLLKWLLTLSFKKGSATHGKRSFLLLTAVILICWIPYFIIYFPGNITPDTVNQLNQIKGIWPYSNHLPFAHTLLLKLCMSIGSLFGGEAVQIAFYTAFQMIIMAASCSASVLLLPKLGAPKAFTCCAIAFYALYPLNAYAAVSVIKDGLFAAVLQLYVVLLFYTVKTKGANLLSNKTLVLFGLTTLSLLLLRHNGVYIIAGTLIFLGVLLLRFKTAFKRTVAATLSLIIISALLQGPIYSALNIKKAALTESLSITILFSAG